MKILKFRFKQGEDKKDSVKPKRNKMFVLHRKQLVAASLMLLLGAAGYLNWSFQNDAVDQDVAVMVQEASKKIGEAQMVNAELSGKVEEEKKENDYFVKARMEREMKRSESAEMLTELLKTQHTDAQAKEDAEAQIHSLAEYTEKEVAAENMIRAKGFRDCVVFMNEEYVSVAVESNGLNEVDAAQIRDIVVSTTGCQAEQIRIVEISIKK